MKATIVKKYRKSWYVNEAGWNFYDPKNKKGLKVVSQQVSITEADGIFVACFTKSGSGGPIMSGSTIEEAETKFEEAFKFMLVINSMMSMPGVKEKLEEEYKLKVK